MIPKERCAISVNYTIQYMVQAVGLSRKEAIDMVIEVAEEMK